MTPGARSCVIAEPGDDLPAVATSVADWIAGYEAGWAAGCYAARTALDDAARYLVAKLRPSRAADIAEHRNRIRKPLPPSLANWRTPQEHDTYRRHVYTSWGLPPPDPLDSPDLMPLAARCAAGGGTHGGAQLAAGEPL